MAHPVLLLALFAIRFRSLLAAQQVKSEQLALLNNAQGLTPCTLGARLQDPCPASVSILQPNQTVISPYTLPSVSVSDCTCNLVFYNIWSACWLYDDAHPPLYSQWKTLCDQNTIPVTTNPLPQRVSEGAKYIPHWATLNVTPDSKFDLAAALSMAKQWTPIQIATPIVVGVGTTLMLVAIYLLYKRARFRRTSKSLHHEWAKQLPHVRGPRKLFGLLPDVGMVRHFDPMDRWHIDGETDSDPLRPNMYRRSFVPLSPPSTSTRSEFAPFSRKLGLADWHITPPWKAAPVAVVSATPMEGFRIDDTKTHRYSMSMSSRADTPTQDDTRMLRDSDPPGSASWFRTFPWRARVSAKAPPVEDSDLSFYAGPSRRSSIATSIVHMEGARPVQELEEGGFGHMSRHPSQSTSSSRFGTPNFTRSPPPWPYAEGEAPQQPAASERLDERQSVASVYSQATPIVSPRPQKSRTGSELDLKFYWDGYPRRPPGVVPARWMS